MQQRVAHLHLNGISTSPVGMRPAVIELSIGILSQVRERLALQRPHVVRWTVLANIFRASTRDIRVSQLWMVAKKRQPVATVDAVHVNDALAGHAAEDMLRHPSTTQALRTHGEHVPCELSNRGNTGDQ